MLRLLSLALLMSACPALAEPTRVLLLGQKPDGHPFATHEYMAGVRIVGKLLAKAPAVEVTIVQADNPWSDGPAMLERADAAVLFLSQGAQWLNSDAARLKAFNRLAARKGGLVCLHWAMGTKDAADIEPWLKLFGGCHGGPDRKYQVLQTDVAPAEPAHPIAEGLRPFKLREEFYYRLKFVKAEPPIRPVLRATIDGAAETVAWAWERPDGGRSFGFSGLHFHENWRRVEYRRLVLQGVLWSLKLPMPASPAQFDVSEEDLKLVKP
jgi:type 1 glutamine amidotransferase